MNQYPETEPGQPSPGLPLQIEAPEEHRTPYLSYGLIGITGFVYILQVVTELVYGVDLPAALGMKVNELISAGQYWRLFTPALLHGSPFHIFFNMYALYAIGADLERRFGSMRFGLLYLGGAFAGNVMSFLFSPNNSLGASTAIFGLLGAEIVFYYHNKKLFGPNARRAIQQVVTVAAINFLFGLSPGIDNWGHLGGFLGGLIYTWFSGPRLTFQVEYPVIRVVENGNTQARSWVGLLLVALLFSAAAWVKINN